MHNNAARTVPLDPGRIAWGFSRILERALTTGYELCGLALPEARKRARDLMLREFGIWIIVRREG